MRKCKTSRLILKCVFACFGHTQETMNLQNRENFHEGKFKMIGEQ